MTYWEVDMAKLISLASHKNKKAADRSFGEWKRLFASITRFDEHTKWADLPDEVVLFFCEESSASKHSFYDLIMNSHRLGSGHEFEIQPFERLSTLLNVYFFITDQARFECMRRLGWLETIPKADKSLIEVVMDPSSYEYASLLETPAPTRLHPCFEEDAQTKGMDRAALVRRWTPEAVEQFRVKVGKEKSSEL